MTYEGLCNHADWHAEHKGSYVWYINGGELDGTYYTTHMPQLVDDYDGELQLWWWEQ